MTTTTKEHEPKHEAKHEHEAEAEAKKREEAAKKREEAARKYNEAALKREEDQRKARKPSDEEERESKFAQADRSEASEKDAIGLLGTIQASATNADGATTTSAHSAFLGGGDVVTCQCTNPATGLTNPCMVVLLLSADDVTYYRADSKWFGMVPSGVYFAKFNMADYADMPDHFGATGPWLWYKIQFTGNHGAGVTVAATNSGT